MPLECFSSKDCRLQLQHQTLRGENWEWVGGWGWMDPTHANDVSEHVTYQRVYWIYREALGWSVIGLEHVFTSRDNSRHKCACRNACFFFSLMFFFYKLLSWDFVCVQNLLGDVYFPPVSSVLDGVLMSLSFFLTSFRGMSLTLIVRMAEECLYRRHWLVRMIRSLSLLAACPFWGRHCSQFSQGSILGNYSPLCLFAGSPFFSFWFLTLFMFLELFHLELWSCLSWCFVLAVSRPEQVCFVSRFRCWVLLNDLLSFLVCASGFSTGQHPSCCDVKHFCMHI